MNTLRSPYLYRILLVDPKTAQKAALSNIIWRALRQAQFIVHLAYSGREGWNTIMRKSPDLVIMSARLPDMEGVTLCESLHGEGFAMPIMMTGCDTTFDCITGLNVGADNCLNSSTAVSEILARVRALLRRVERQSNHLLTFADLSLDLQLCQAQRGKQILNLGQIEFNLLRLFLDHPSQVLTRNHIITSIWGHNCDLESNMLEVYIHHLRRKLGKPNLIETKRYVGYVLREAKT